MPTSHVLIGAWVRSPIAPVDGAFKAWEPHQLGAPLIHALLARSGLPVQAVDAVIAGNALGAGGNPARLTALAAGLPEHCAALSVDTQCCSGLDAISMAAGWIAMGQADVVIAGGIEAWSRAPIRQHRPRHPGEPARAYDRPAFAPDPARDPDLLAAAAHYAAQHGIGRTAQDPYAVLSHQRALASRALLATEICPLAGLDHDVLPRPLTLARAARWPMRIVPPDRDHDQQVTDTGISALGISAKADGAALVLLASPKACSRWGLQPQAVWMGARSTGTASDQPMLAAALATEQLLAHSGLGQVQALDVLEMHDAFAVQGIDFCARLKCSPDTVNRHGGGLARGHPIGASGAIALVRVLTDLQREHRSGATGLACIAGAGGIGSAVLVRRV